SQELRILEDFRKGFAQNGYSIRRGRWRDGESTPYRQGGGLDSHDRLAERAGRQLFIHRQILEPRRCYPTSNNRSDDTLIHCELDRGRESGPAVDFLALERTQDVAVRGIAGDKLELGAGKFF